MTFLEWLIMQKDPPVPPTITEERWRTLSRRALEHQTDTMTEYEMTVRYLMAIQQLRLAILS